MIKEIILKSLYEALETILSANFSEASSKDIGMLLGVLSITFVTGLVTHGLAVAIVATLIHLAIAVVITYVIIAVVLFLVNLLAE